ncbi:AraC family transcriptional regulator ligand-binding domain-containing protein [Chitinophagaceae bacterium LWZ2-11]
MEDYKKRFVMNMLAYAAQRDLDPAYLCKLASIDFNKLKKKEVTLFTDKQINDLWLNASVLSSDPVFGLHFGESLQTAALGMVGEIIKSSTTVGEAITLAASLTHLVTDLLTMEVIKSTKNFTIRFIAGKQEEEPSFVFKQTMDFFMVFTVHELDGLVLEKIKPSSAKLSYTPTSLHEYERVLRCRPVKKKGEYSLTFENKYWNEPILTANYELQNLLLKKVNAVSGESQNDQSLQRRIYNYLLTNAYLGIISLEEIAANFNTSPRTLQRKLKEEGIGYQEVADNVRKSLAIHYLQSGSYQIKEISYMLGYNELSAFSRAFKKWTGVAPAFYGK